MHLLAKVRVEVVSVVFDIAGPIVATNKVLESCPKESWRILVSFESRKGMCLEAGSIREAATFPRAARDVFIDFASSSWRPVLLFLLTLSDPAKSTKTSFDDTSSGLPVVWETEFRVTCMVSTVWLRLDVVLRRVGIITRL